MKKKLTAGLVPMLVALALVPGTAGASSQTGCRGAYELMSATAYPSADRDSDGWICIAAHGNGSVSITDNGSVREFAGNALRVVSTQALAASGKRRHAGHR